MDFLLRHLVGYIFLPKVIVSVAVGAVLMMRLIYDSSV